MAGLHGQEQAIAFGDLELPSQAQCAKGTPVLAMWQAQQPSVERGAGLSLLKSAEHHTVWQPQQEDEGAYNHYATLIRHNDSLYLMWGNHPLGEDGPGQRILYAMSDVWGRWSAPRELFAAPGPVKERSEHGIHLKPDRWVAINGRLYAVIFVFDAGQYAIARELHDDGTQGEPFVVFPENDMAKHITSLPLFMNTERRLLVAEKIRAHYEELGQVSWWGRFASTEQQVPVQGIDGSQLIESFAYPTADGRQVLMARNWGTPSNPVHNNRMYVSVRRSGDHWPTPYPSDIPDAPSRAQALTLDDGQVLLIGCQNASCFDKALYLDRDPLTVAVSSNGYRFERVFALRSAAHRHYRFSGIPGRNHGYAYPSAIVDDGWLIVAYSVSKEDMAISRVRLSDLGTSQ